MEHAGIIYVFDYVPGNPASDAIYLGDIENIMKSVKFDSRFPENVPPVVKQSLILNYHFKIIQLRIVPMEENDINAFTTNVTSGYQNPTANLMGEKSEATDNEIKTTPSAESAGISIVPGASSPENGKYFDPASITVPAGTAVTWTNDDTTLHTVTSGSPESGYSAQFDSSYFSW